MKTTPAPKPVLDILDPRDLELGPFASGQPRDDASPWTVTIPGQDPASTFQVALAPGASISWQTDGSGIYTTGTAVIRSDRPIGVQTLVTSVDASGATLSETAAAEAQPRSQLALPFDTTTDVNPAVAFYNMGSKPATISLTLLDSNGKNMASTQLVFLAVGFCFFIVPIRSAAFASSLFLRSSHTESKSVEPDGL